MTDENQRPTVSTSDPMIEVHPTESEAAEPSLLTRLFSLGRERDDATGELDASSDDATTDDPATRDEPTHDESAGERSAGDAGRDNAADGEGTGDADDDSESSLLGSITDRAESAAETVGKAVTHTTATIVRGAGSLAAGAGSLAAGAGSLAVGAARRFEDRPAARARQAGRTSRDPLPVLWEVHPGAVNAARRDLGLETVPLEQVRGTAVEGSQRGGDFKPIPRLRGSNWQGRWHRIKSAINRLEALPPVDLLKTGDEYWVVDGHNRVAAALELDQVALDASVVELLLPGMPRGEAPTDAGRYLVDSMREVRAAGEGRRSRTADAAMGLEDTEALRRDFDHDHEAVGE